MLNGFIYAIGGYDGPTIHRSVERFDPTTKMWSPAADMSTYRRNAGYYLFPLNIFFDFKIVFSLKGVATHEGLLYVIGGYDGATHLNSVEVYNPITNSWLMLPSSMAFPRSYFGTAIVNRPFCKS